LEGGRAVISDRYFFSAVANLRARGYREDRWIYELGDLLPRPDLAVFCEPPFELICRRLAAREEERGRFFDLEFNRVLYKEFRVVRAAYPGALALDTTASPECVYASLRPYLAGLPRWPLSVQDAGRLCDGN
jgi:thymidylate kinase